MKNCLGLLFAFSLFLCLPGCGGHQGGTATENAEQSAIEAYQAAEAADQAAMLDMDVSEDAGSADTSTADASGESPE